MWCAVEVSGRWLPADVCWAAGYVDEDTGHFTRHVSPYYFLCDPRQFSRDHLPCDPRRQLIKQECHVKMADFVSRPHLKPNYYTLGFIRHTPDTGVIQCEPGRCVNIHLTCYRYRDLLLTYRLRHLQSGASHDTFVSFRTQEYNIHFRICPLTIGVYRFTVYGQSYAKQQCPMSLISYSIIGADNYDIKCIPDILWGPTAALSSYGLNLEPNMRSCLMMDNTQPCKISFESPNAHAIQLKILCHSIRSKDIVTYIRYSIHRRKSLGEVSIILTSSLKPGSYRLALFASEDEQSDVYSCVFNYLLHITSPTHYDVC